MTTDSATGNEEQAVLALLQRWLDAAKKGDAATLSTMLTDNYTYTHASTGEADSRDAWLDIFRPESPRFRTYRAYEVADVSVRLFPGTAVVAGRGHQEIIRATGEVIDLNTSFTCVWVQQEGAWRLVAWQATRLPDAPRG